MPRRAKPRVPSVPYNTGTARPGPVQAPAAPTDMPYGEHQTSIEAQRAIPLPGPSAGAPAGGPGPPPPPMGDDQILSAAAGHQFAPVDLTAAPEGPEPLTSGLPIGPGAGPLMRPAGPSAADTLELIATYTGDPLFAQLAARSRLRATAGQKPPAVGVPASGPTNAPAPLFPSGTASPAVPDITSTGPPPQTPGVV